MSIFKKKPVQKKEEIFDISSDTLCVPSALPGIGADLVSAACEIIGPNTKVMCADGKRYVDALRLMGVSDELLNNGECYILRDDKTHHIYGAVVGMLAKKAHSEQTAIEINYNIFKEPVHTPARHHINQITELDRGYLFIDMVVPDSRDVKSKVVLADLTDIFDTAVNSYARYTKYIAAYNKLK